MKKFLLLFSIIWIFLFQHELFAQDEAVHPNVIITPVAFEITGPLSDNPIDLSFELDQAEFYMNKQRDRKINPNIFPPDFENMPEDLGVQTKAGWIDGSKATLMNFAGQNSGYYPPDANGTVGANYYFQVVNVTYAIYNKSTGAVVAGPSPLNSIFNSSLPGATCNNGDPIVLWDEHADRWFYAEFSLCTSNDYMLIAVSQTSDPTGSWYSWSYDVDDLPDYMKFGIWQDGYYMATNTGGAGKNDVYVFDRATMIAGGASPTMIGFDNPWRPVTFDGFHCILPLDNDGPWAPTGDPGQFITIADGDQGNPADELYIYELNADWGTPSNSTFLRTQTLSVNPFYGNFNNSWNNIPQVGSSQTLDGLSTILMYRAQYRNFSGTQRLVCAHAIAATSSEADMRWYELENTGSGWSIRQQNTYNPDNISRWNMSIAMNGDREIGIGYSVSNLSMHPGIRYIGQSAASNAAANNTLDMAETTIWTGSYSQSSYNRWGDYANISVDPTDDHVFWFTSEYVASTTHGTRIASFQFSSPSSPPVANFSANNLYPANSLTTVAFTDLSSGNPTTWSWSFSPNTVTYVVGNSSSQNPQIRFNSAGAYTVSLTATNTYGNDTETKTDYIHVGQPGLWTGATSIDWNTTTNWDNEEIPISSTAVSITPAAIRWPTKTGNLIVGTDCNSLNMSSGYTELTVTGDLTISPGNTFYVDPTGIPNIYLGGNWTNNATFTPGQSTLEFIGTNNSAINAPPGGPAYLINENFIAWPGNWNGDVAGGAGQFGQSASSNAGSISPEAVFTRGANITATRRMYHNPVNTTGLTSLTLSFTHSVDYRQTGTIIKVQYSTDGVNWNDAGWSVSPTANIPATPISVTLTTSEGVGAANYYIAFVFDGRLNRIDYWYIDDVQLYFSTSGLEIFNNLTINKTNALISTNGSIDVQNAFTINPGAYFTNSSGNTLNVFGNAQFMADLSGMASFIDNGTSNFAIPPDVQLYLTYNNWHFVSSPVAGAQSGVFTGYYLYSFDESLDDWVNIVPTGISLNIMQGYSAWVPTNPALVIFQGQPNNGPFNIPVTRNATQSDYGWNLVGNPYPSSLDWDAVSWTKTNVNNTIYYYSGAGGLNNYQYYIGAGGETPGVGVNSGTNEIPPMQGFFVHASANGTLGVSNTARIHSNQAYYKSSGNPEFSIQNPFIRIQADGMGLSDETVIRFVQESTEDFDGNFDAFKLFASDYPQVYTTFGNTDFAVNTLPAIVDELVIPLAFNAPAPGTFFLTFTQLSGFSKIPYLEDLQEGSIQKISSNFIYTFDYTPMQPDQRFLIHFSNPLGLVENRPVS